MWPGVKNANICFHHVCSWSSWRQRANLIRHYWGPNWWQIVRKISSGRMFQPPCLSMSLLPGKTGRKVASCTTWVPCGSLNSNQFLLIWCCFDIVHCVYYFEDPLGLWYLSHYGGHHYDGLGALCSLVGWPHVQAWLSWSKQGTVNP